MSRSARLITDEGGQALPAFASIAAVASALGVVSFGAAQAMVGLAERQSSADIAALAGAKELFLGSTAGVVRDRANRLLRANGNFAGAVVVSSIGEGQPRVRVRVDTPLRIGVGGLMLTIGVHRTATAAVRDIFGAADTAGPGDYPGPFAFRQGKPMRPDVALAFDRMARAAGAAGHQLVVVSAWRSSAEQARLFAAHPDPRWVAPPGKSLHRLGTELDLGPAGTYDWLLANSGRFGFLRRYPWEPWHFGYTRSPGSASVGFGNQARSPGTGGALPSWVPASYRAPIISASIRWGVSAALLAAQIRAESDFQPRTVSSAGAQGISQLMPDEARRFHVDPFEPAQAIGAQAQLMRELLARFGSVPLALAAYNAGAGVVSRCGCIPPYPETRAYVARIIGWLKGAGSGSFGPSIALIE